MRKILLLGVKLALIIVGVGVLFGVGMAYQGLTNKFRTDSARASAHAFVNLIATGYADKAYPMSSKGFQEKMPEASFVAQMGGLKSEDPNYLPPQTFVKGNTAYYFQKVENLPKTAAGRTDGNFSVSMVKEGGDWKVVAVTVD